MTIDVYVSNISEDVWDFIKTMSVKEQQLEIADNASLCDRELLANLSDRKTIFIAPKKIDPKFFNYYQELFDRKNLTVWTPKKHSGQTCLDLCEDKKLFAELAKLGLEHELLLRSYSASEQFFELHKRLVQAGAKVSTPEAPRPDKVWTVNFFGSKSGIRQTAYKLQSPSHPWMGEGVITYGLDQIALTAADWYCQDQGVVIKTTKAHSGVGVLIFRAGDLPNDFANCYKKIKEILNGDQYWQRLPVVIEQLIDIEYSVGGGNPNIELFVSDNGTVTTLYTCGMRVKKTGVFQGVEIGQNVLPEETEKQLINFGRRLGHEYAEAGYRGYFDVDCMYTTDGKLYITESNVRRTGGTHVYHAAKKLCGRDFRKRYILSTNNYDLPAGYKFTFEHMQQLLKPIMFSSKTKEGLVLAGANVFTEQKMSYIIFGKTEQRALAIEKQMEQMIASVNLRK